MLEIDNQLRPEDLAPALERVFDLARHKLGSIRRSWAPDQGAPVFTVKGRYTSRGWTEWTQGFLFGMAILHFDATGDQDSLAFGRENTISVMTPHLTHTGVHDHGFNNVSTYGNLFRLMKTGKLPDNSWERLFYSLAIKVSGAVQASRWTDLPDELGYIYSFNGPHSLFIDTIRTLRVLALSHNLGHTLMTEQDRKVSLLERLLRHCITTSRFNVYHGDGRDCYDLPGRVSHEAVFNINNGTYRCPNSQQGYTPFSTWTRGLAWALTGFAEELEYLVFLAEDEFRSVSAGGMRGRTILLESLQASAEETAEFYLSRTPVDGIPYWDTGAPGLARLPDYLDRKSDPLNEYEPVDSSAAAIAAQGLIRLGRYFTGRGDTLRGSRYLQAGLTAARALFEAPYLSTDPAHQGLILHSVYHRPNGWDYIPPGRKIPCGESSIWGDYHALELALLIKYLIEGKYFTFF